MLVAGMAILGAVYDRDPKAVTDGLVRRVAHGLRGEAGADQTRGEGQAVLRRKSAEDVVGKEK